MPPGVSARAVWFALVMLALGTSTYAADDWQNIVFTSNTVGNESNRLCMGAPGHRRPSDVGCPSYAPSLSTAGHVSITGNVSANKFIGDGSGLTGVGSGDRIVSGTSPFTQMLAVSDTRYISITQGGANTAWFDPTRGLVTLGVSATGPISGTHGYFSGNVGIGTIAPAVTVDVSGAVRVTGPLVTGFQGMDRVEFGTSGGTPRILLEDDSHGSVAQIDKLGTNMRFLGGLDGVITFRPFSAELVRFTGTGQVGISTTAPLAKLDVVGTISASDAIQVGSSSLVCSTPISGSIRYKAGSLELCDGTSWDGLGGGGAGVSAMSSLTDVQLTNTAGRDYLRYDAIGGKWVNISESTVMSTTTMADGWPDAIMCDITTPANNGMRVMYLSYAPHTSTGTYLYRSEENTNERAYMQLAFTAAKAYSSFNYYSGSSQPVTSDCNSKSIAQLYAEGRAFNFIGGIDGDAGSPVEGDRITSGTLAVVANSATSIVSLTTNGTTWGYLGNAASYLPTITANKVSSTNISATYVHLNSATTPLACDSGFTGAMRYTSGTMQVCDGNNWGNIGIGVPGGTIAAFEAVSCPAGWSEYTPARGRFLRGIDTLAAGIDPSGTRAPGNIQEDTLQNVTGFFGGTNLSTDGPFYVDGGSGNFGSSGTGARRNIAFDLSLSARTSTETRPKNVAVIYCQYNGYNTELSTGVATLASLSDVAVGSVATGHVLAFDGSSWVPSNTSSVGLLNDLTDVNTAGAVAGNVIRYNGSSWVVSDATSVAALSSLTDVTLTNLAGRDHLRYDAISSKWVNISESTVMSTTTMIDGWPDAISCSNGTVTRVLYMRWYDPSSQVQYTEGTDSAASRYFVRFDSDGTYDTHSNFPGYDCVSNAWSISDLYANGRAFNFIGGANVAGSSAEGDRLTSGTLSVVANSATSIISLSTGGTTWGYLGSAASYLPAISAARVSATNVSGTYLQLSSPTTALACGSGLAGTMRYTSGTMQVCNGSSWSNIGIGVPTGGIVAFAASSCPSGWSEYTASRGRFLRGIDNGAGNDPAGTRAPGNTQTDALQGHWHRATGGNDVITWVGSGGSGDYAGGGELRGADIEDPISDGSNGTPRTANETRPKNVAVTFCRYDGYESQLATGVATLASLSDVSVGGVVAGQVLAFDGSSWVPSNTSSVGLLNDLTDVNTAGAVAGNVIRYDGSNWVVSDATSVAAMTSLTDVTLTNLAGRDYLRYDAVSSKWVNISESTVMSTTTMVDRWPDAIVCNSGANRRVLFHDIADSNYVNYHMAQSGAGGYISMIFNKSTRAYYSHAGMTGFDCLNQSIQQLYASGQAFNFIGSANVASTVDADRITSGTLAVVANTAGNYVSLTTGGTTWGYFGQSANYLPSLLTVGGNISATGGISVTGSVQAYSYLHLSDERLKDTITNIPNAADILIKLRGTHFRWKAGKQFSYGLIAQEVEKVVPDLVTDGEGLKAVDYDQLAPILLEGWKVHHKAIKALVAENDNLRRDLHSANDNHKKAIDALEQRIRKLEAAGAVR